MLRDALEMAATSFVLCHNHPDGDPKPTDEDVFLTNAVQHAAHLIGVPLDDHVIVTPPPGASPLCSGAETGPVRPPHLRDANPRR
ncbi:JAB domain-containing protein [Sorangium sp. So ce321]|uniref:JAB domain-containing protein n=1 Tax=Sorangium sp. So ce321 TaxID=3133300 RepID=UPI003F613C25